MPNPVFLGGCQVKVDLDKKSPAEIECRYDRERLANPELQEGMVCGPQISSFEKDRKLYLRFELVCRPAVRVFRKLHYVPSPKVMEELKQLLRQQKMSKPSLPSAKPPGEMIFRDRLSPKLREEFKRFFRQQIKPLPPVIPQALKPSGLITA
jgi:hypothetical protein